MDRDDIEADPELTLMDIVFVGFNRRVVALHRDNGEILWDWKAPQGSGLPTVLLDGDRVVVSVQGYMYCLDPLTGDLLWSNPLTGYGVGTACLASLYGNSGSVAAAAVIAQQQAAGGAGAGAAS